MMSQAVEPNTRLQGRVLSIGRALWLLLTAVAIAIFLINIPIQYAFYQTICTTACQNLQLTPEPAQQLAGFGLSVQAYAAYFTGLGIFEGLVFLAVGFVIFWRRSDDWMALYVSLTLILWQIGGGVTPSRGLNPFFVQTALVLTALGNAGIALFFFLFPDGRFVPRWIRWFAPLIVLREVLAVFLPDNELLQNLFFILVPFVLLSQVYRYWRVSTGLQRQQTKWVVFGATLGMLGFAGTLVTYGLVFPNGQPNTVVASILAGTLIGLFLLCVPLSIAMAILRSHLWDIDILIRRTVTYALVAAMLAVVYFGCVVLLQQIFVSVTGQRSEVITVLSTLAIAALFVPLRSRVQDAIDRRFNRKKYDAAQVMSAFATTVRDETDLERLTGSLVGVVNETMQPRSVSMWLKTMGDQRQTATER